MNILLIGSGGREHALAWKIKQSSRCKKLYVAPGNAGTSTVAKNINVAVNDFEGIEKIILEKDIQLVVVGPEDPLVNGLRNHIESSEKLKKILIVGPGREGAILEGSKDFSKQFMQRHGIPTAISKTFTKTTLEEGLAYIKGMTPPVVLKADGLAAGKGVIISENLKEAAEALREMLLEQKFGAASEKVVIEQFLSGIEISVFVLTDGVNYKILPEAKDYKRIGEGDTGPNTGGMGAVSPVHFADESFMKKVEERIIKPTIAGLRSEDIPFRGFVFFGLMNVGGNPYLIEYNVRMGDPETEAVVPRLKSDLVDLLVSTASGTLDDAPLEIEKDFAATVVLVSEGYPGPYEKNRVISGIENINNALVFHAGTTTNKEKEIVTNGGRVIAITGRGSTLNIALENAYKAVDNISWDGKNCRRDIGVDLMVNI